MRFYKPRRTVGGHVGKNIFNTVMNSAKKFAQSELGQKIGTQAKKKVLQIGSDVLNNVMAGKKIVPSIKDGVDQLKAQLPKSTRKRLKQRVFNQPSKKSKLGGVIRYKLARKYSKKLPKKASELLYKLNLKKKDKFPKKVSELLYKLNTRKKVQTKRKKRKSTGIKRRKRGAKRMVKKKKKKNKKKSSKKRKGKKVKRRVRRGGKRKISRRRATRKFPKSTKTIFD